MAKALKSAPWVRDTNDVTALQDVTFPALVYYAIAAALVVLAAFLAVPASQFVPSAGLTLIFVLPVVIAGAWLGWGPAILTIAASVLTYDFFFTQPYYSLRINDPAELWAAGLLLITAAIVGAISWQSRRYAFAARRAAEQAKSLHGLAHAIVHGGADLNAAIATSLADVFSAPSAVLISAGDRLRVVGHARGAQMSDAELKACETALSDNAPVRAQMFPHEQSRYDVWPVIAPSSRRYVLAVDFSRAEHERPDNADMLVEMIGAYLEAGTRHLDAHSARP